jgi:hypothetical protein
MLSSILLNLFRVKYYENVNKLFFLTTISLEIYSQEFKSIIVLDIYKM